jgi:hypothetical protein
LVNGKSDGLTLPSELGANVFRTGSETDAVTEGFKKWAAANEVAFIVGCDRVATEGYGVAAWVAKFEGVDRGGTAAATCGVTNG